MPTALLWELTRLQEITIEVVIIMQSRAAIAASLMRLWCAIGDFIPYNMRARDDYAGKTAERRRAKGAILRFDTRVYNMTIFA